MFDVKLVSILIFYGCKTDNVLWITAKKLNREIIEEVIFQFLAISKYGEGMAEL
jgi:hypothetical protein